jgi:hypothetical protein
MIAVNPGFDRVVYCFKNEVIVLKKNRNYGNIN